MEVPPFKEEVFHPPKTKKLKRVKRLLWTTEGTIQPKETLHNQHNPGPASDRGFLLNLFGTEILFYIWSFFFA